MYMLQSHKDLRAWQFAYLLTKEVYTLTKAFPSSEKYGLISQMRRAAVSVPSNLAEGYNRSSRGEYRQFCSIALGSANELETQLLLARDLGMAPIFSFKPAEELLSSTLKLIGALRRSI